MSRPPKPPPGYYLAPHVSIEAIQIAVAEWFKIGLIEMVSDRRGWRVSHPRQLAIFLARDLTAYSYPNIGRFFGRRDHTTVMHAVEQVEKRIAADPDFGDMVQKLKSVLVSTGNNASAKKSIVCCLGAAA
ncbi:MAG: dnaA [Bradyrhizobium sp.]|nr:dnaA [Bradyrhizobium sp.]